MDRCYVVAAMEFLGCSIFSLKSILPTLKFDINIVKTDE